MASPRNAHAAALVALAAAFAGTGCVKELPPAPTPDEVVPDVGAEAPPAEGQGRLVVDVVDGPTPIHRVRMESEEVQRGEGRTSYRFYEAREIACPESPCVLDLPVGNVLLGFPVLGDSGVVESELVHVGAEPSVYRRSLSVYDDSSGALFVLGIIAASVGSAAAITGAVLLPVGLGDDNDGLALAGGITLGAGAALIALGSWFIDLDAPTFRPGSAAHFPMPGAGP